MAPDWVSPTEDNGLAAPRGDLYIALVVDKRETYDYLKDGHIRVVPPPLWKGGTVHLRILFNENVDKPVDIRLRLALVDMGLIDSADADLLVPEIGLGYPSGDKP